MRRSLWLALFAIACTNHEEPTIGAPAPAQETLPASAYLSVLPDGETKRRFIIDCTGCHTYHSGIAYPAGVARDRESWHERTSSMVQRFGASSGFPVISAARDPDATAAWLATTMPARGEVKWSWPTVGAGKADIREYTLPGSGDLPHDLAVQGDEVAITGMFTSRMYVLNAETGAVTTTPTPEPNPRAVEIDGAGNWWVVLGGPQKLARRSPNGEWRTWPVGFYAHSVALAPDGGVWANGHFTHRPELIKRLDPATGAVQSFEVPPHPQFNNTPVPYEIRVGGDGIVWMSELQGNRIVRLNPANGETRVWTMPTTASGPRRLDVDASGVVWIPEYGANKLARFDPGTEKFTEYELPIKDAAPYIARYDARRKVVWLGTGMADALFRFNPETAHFTYYRLPTPDALVRHLTIAPNGDIWLAPGSSPGTTPARVVRVRPQD